MLKLDNRTPQQIDLDETLLRGGAFEQMVNTEGWKYILAYYQNQIRILTNEMMNHPEKPISDFESDRQRIIGIKGMIGQVTNTLDSVERYRKEQHGQHEAKA